MHATNPARGWRFTLLALCAHLALNGCSTLGFSDDEETQPPAELQPIEARLQLAVAWQADVGQGTEQQGYKLQPAIDRGVIYSAGSGGLLEAREASTGNLLWRQQSELTLTAGPGVGEGLLLVGTDDAEVAAFALQDGKQLWRTRISNEILSIPRAINDRVVAMAIDNQVHGLDTASGEIKWFYSRANPVLTLYGSSSPVISGGRAIVGFAGGDLVTLEARSGDPLWEISVSEARGRSELERIVDIDTDPLVYDNRIYVGSYQGNVAAVSEDSGIILWKRPLSTHQGFAVNWRYLFVPDDQDQLWALDPVSGSAAWKQDALLHRRLSQPTLIDDYLVVGDFEGYLHWLDQDDGRVLGRIKTGGAAIVGKPIQYDDTIIAYAADGRLIAVRASPVSAQEP
jgi:outer membrane protein assembly factor BamB